MPGVQCTLLLGSLPDLTVLLPPLLIRAQVNNATTYLVTLNVQLVALSGNATVLTSKAPGEPGVPFDCTHLS